MLFLEAIFSYLLSALTLLQQARVKPLNQWSLAGDLAIAWAPNSSIAAAGGRRGLFAQGRRERERERERGLEPHGVWLCGCVLAGLYLPKRPLKRFLKTRSGFFSSPYYSPVVTLAASVSINSSTWIAIVNRVCALLPSFTWAPLRLVRAVLFKTFKFGTWLQQLSVDSIVVSFSKSGN